MDRDYFDLAKSFDADWIEGQESFIPECIKPSWRKVCKHLRLTRSPDAAEQFLVTHATSVPTCPDCNGWLKWLKFGGSNHG